ncbi:MAG: hypothetical protein ABSA65_12370 [Acidimicrobiales bacterium]
MSIDVTRNRALGRTTHSDPTAFALAMFWQNVGQKARRTPRDRRSNESPIGTLPAEESCVPYLTTL